MDVRDSLGGVIPAVVTPFGEDGRIDVTWMERHLSFLREAGVHGILACGTTGEGPSLGLSERKQVIDVCLQNRGAMAVMAGTGCASLTDTVELSCHAVERGADVLLVVPPFYFKNPSEEGLVQYYRALLRALPTQARLALYNIPGFSAVEVTDSLLYRLSFDFPQQVAGVKDSSGSAERTLAYIERHPQLTIWAGNEGTAAAALRGGACGVISALANAFPDVMLNLWRARQRGEDLAPWDASIQRLQQATRGHSPAAAAKCLLAAVHGFPATHVRPPLVDLTPEERPRLVEAVRAALQHE